MWLEFPSVKLNKKSIGTGKKYGNFITCHGKFEKTANGFVPDGPVRLRFNFSNHFFLGGDREENGDVPVTRFFMFGLKNITTERHTSAIFDLPPFTHPRSVAACAIVDEYVYLIGGYDGRQSVNHVERFNFLTGHWEVCRAISERRSSLSAVAFEGHIYIFGGLQCTRCFSEIEKYNPDLNCWTLCRHLHYGRSGANCVEINGKVYVFGGIADSNGFIPPLEIYDIRSNTIEVCHDIRLNMVSFGIEKFQVENQWYIILIGGMKQPGYDAGRECYLYHVGEGKIIPIPRLRKARKYVHVQYEKNKVYVYGGYDGEQIVSDCEIFYVKTKRWRYIPSRFPLCGSNGFAISQNPIVEYFGNFRKGILEGEVTKNQCLYGSYYNNQKHGYFFNSLGKKYFFQGKHCSEETFRRLENLDDIPLSFQCPISLQIMIQPYVTSCGTTYEKSFIEQWLEKKKVDPSTRESIQPYIYPNRCLQQIIMEYLETKGIQF